VGRGYDVTVMYSVPEPATFLLLVHKRVAQASLMVYTIQRSEITVACNINNSYFPCVIGDYCDEITSGWIQEIASRHDDHVTLRDAVYRRRRVLRNTFM
jgi:hypothetical protein